jgi:hypothetical protein
MQKEKKKTKPKMEHEEYILEYVLREGGEMSSLEGEEGMVFGPRYS